MTHISLKKFLALLCVLLTLFTIASGFHPAFAADQEFTTQQTSTYAVQQTGNTHVEKKFQITNHTPTRYISQYSMEIGSSKLANIVVSSDQGKLAANVVTSANATSISVSFPDQVVGEGKVRTFTLSYDSSDTAVVSGSTLEVYLPKLTKSSDYSSDTTVLKTPRSFGKPARVTPAKYTLTEDTNFYTLTFNQLAEQSVSALFGNRQYFQFHLKYEIANTTNSVGITQVALPPDTSYQRVTYDNLSPTPQSITRDKDGNWIATYEVAAQKELNISAEGKASVTIEPNDVPVTTPDASYTSAQKYWESDQPQIKQLAQQYPTARKIYDYLTQTFHYNYNRAQGEAERFGAARAVAAPDQAICQEFADTFVALARANGIPARRLAGYAYTANNRLRPLSLVQDILHAWPEYYDQTQKQWIPVDPTWGQTTGGMNYFDQLDFNHLVFAINGQSSSLPYAAGSYRKAENTSHQVDVSFSQAFQLPNLDVDVQVQKVPWFLSFPRSQFSLQIHNKTGAAFYNLPIRLHSNLAEISLQATELQLPVLLPYQTASIPVIVTNPTWQPHSFTLTVEGEQLSSAYELHSGFDLQDFRQAPQLAISVGGSVVVIAIIAGGVLVSRRPRQRLIRR